jgi:hypothetical protein
MPTISLASKVIKSVPNRSSNADVSVCRDYRLEDFASFRKCLLRQILATPDEHVERIEHDVRLRRTAILKQIEVRFSLLVKCNDFAVDHGLIREAR